MRPFQWQGDRLVADLDSHEAQLLKQLVGEIQELLSVEAPSAVASASGSVVDPVAERLLPDGHRDDPELAADYRSLTEEGLRRDKLADAAAVLDSIGQDGGRVDIDAEAAQAWLRTLNDVRLGIGVRLDVQESDDPLERVEETGDVRWAAYSWLTAVQGLLVDVLASPRERST
ncbi:MAG: DUF2017 domain-containing protein [Actinomycetota bacterium]|nr:DUF2017 domain-containing protein [Actinomycetota bacterium]